ncbi:FAD-dependent monooxygenase [Paraburkholderia phymatum]|uniref:FAD-dependent monooxygenase n=1 Tax=Paraburkholderia phymatum TaxID=148447 RepID=UPI00317A83B5
MYQPNTTPHRSSYFDYEIYPFKRSPEAGAATLTHHPVVVIGAGPIGLVLAIQLAQQGVAPVLIEAEAQVCGGSRALALTRRSMEIFEQCGVAERVLEGALLWKDGYSYYKGKPVHHMKLSFAEDDKFYPMTNLAQCDIEKILLDRVFELGIDVRFQTKLVAQEAHDEGVTLTLDTPEGGYRIDAQWLVACDGARSTVRKLQQLRFEGESFESRFVIADFRIDLDEPAGRRAYFDPPWLPGQTALMHKAPKGVWRLDYQVPEGMSDEAALDDAKIRKNIKDHLAYIGVHLPWEVEWTTIYKPNALTLGSYANGRTFYCGDAAHLLPVFGVRGMNTGVQDSLNLAWKLAAVLQGRADAKLLDSYSVERVADARQICVEASRSTRMYAPPSEGFRIMQQAVLSLCLDHAFPQDLLHWRTSHPIDYLASPLTQIDASGAQFESGPRPGAPARNVRLADGTYLFDHLARSFNVLMFGTDAVTWERAAQDVKRLNAEGIPVRLVAVRSEGERPTHADVFVLDANGHVASMWGATEDAVYVMRPDQHICARWRVGSAANVADAVHQVLRGGRA